VKDLVSKDVTELRAELHDLVNEAQANEVRILLFLARRYVALGQRNYGVLKLFDGRNNTVERMEELADEQFYWAKDELEQQLLPRRRRGFWSQLWKRLIG